MMTSRNGRGFDTAMRRGDLERAEKIFAKRAAKKREFREPARRVA